MKPASLLALLLLAVGAQAQTTVWRCGADGRSYTDSPCPGGQVVAVADPRSPADVAEARLVAAREQHLARALVQDRREREARQRGNGLAGVKPAEVLRPRPEPDWRPRPLSKRHSPSATRTSREADRASRQRQG